MLAIWQVFALSGMFSTAMTPPLGSIAAIMWRMMVDGTLLDNTIATIVRVFIGL